MGGNQGVFYEAQCPLVNVKLPLLSESKPWTAGITNYQLDSKYLDLAKMSFWSL